MRKAENRVPGVVCDTANAIQRIGQISHTPNGAEIAVEATSGQAYTKYVAYMSG